MFTLPLVVACNLSPREFEQTDETLEFGHADTLISAKDFGKSISYPRESPTSGMVSFIGLDYGYFSIYNQEADVYFYNTETGKVDMYPRKVLAFIKDGADTSAFNMAASISVSSGATIPASKEETDFYHHD